MFSKTKIILAVLTLSIMNASLAFGARNHIGYHQSEAIVVQNPWIRSAPTNAPALAAFMYIYNDTNEDINLISADSDWYPNIEFHQTIEEGDVMKMVEQKSVPIPARGELQMKPGGWHMMLMNPHRVPILGEVVQITLQFDNGLYQTVMFKVKRTQSGGDFYFQNHR
jgi:copper(I)-binding protein